MNHKGRSHNWSRVTIQAWNLTITQIQKFDLSALCTIFPGNLGEKGVRESKTNRRSEKKAYTAAIRSVCLSCRLRSENNRKVSNSPRSCSVKLGEGTLPRDETPFAQPPTKTTAAVSNFPSGCIYSIIS